MADALLSPAVGTTFWAGSLGIIAYCSKRLKNDIKERNPWGQIFIIDKSKRSIEKKKI